MLNVNDLENKWFKYKIKSYIPHIIIFFIIVMIIIISIVFVDFNQNITEKKSQNTIQKIKNKQSETTEKSKVETKQKIQTPENKPKKIKQHKKEVQKKESKLILTPSLNFIKYMQDSTLSYYENDDTEDIIEKKVKKVKKIEKKRKEVEKKIQKKVDKKQISMTIQKAKSVITINKENTLQDIQEVIKRFKINNNPALSLFVAKKYYELGQYNKSYNYALITNEINSDIEASWIIFAKSLVKLNEKEMAVKTLKKYIKHTHSNNAKILLNNINSGKFK